MRFITPILVLLFCSSIRSQNFDFSITPSSNCLNSSGSLTLNVGQIAPYPGSQISYSWGGAGPHEPLMYGDVGKSTKMLIGLCGTYTITHYALSNPTKSVVASVSHTFEPICAMMKISVSPSTLVCAGTSATLQASGAETYDWINGPTNTSLRIVSPFSKTKYHVVGQIQGCSGHAEIDLDVDACTGLAANPVDAAWYSLFPNPANDHLVIEVSTALSKTEFSCAIYNCLGSLIREDEIRLNSKTNLNVSQLSPGVYTLILKTPEGYSVTKKFVISD